MNKLPPILIVDDQWPMRQALAGALHDMGFQEVLQATDGQEAMRILRAAQVAAVISNWEMRGMTGLGVLRWLRNEMKMTNLPFMLIGIETDPEWARAAIEAGASEYLVKPYTVHELTNKVKRLFGNERCNTLLNPVAGDTVLGLANVSEVEARVESSTILIVDDAPSNIEIIAEILKDDYAVLTADSGYQALEIASSSQQPDLILLDVMMPELDGYEVCRRLNLNPVTRDIPIIFLTSNDSVEDIVHGLQLGAVDYISKPAEPGILKARIHTHLRLRVAFADLARQNASLAASAKLREDIERITQHDLKNPITAIISNCETLLEDGGHEDEHTEMIRSIESEAWRALHQVNQSLNLYRMETGTFVLRPEAVDLVATLTTVRQETVGAFAGLSLDIRFSDNGGSVALGRYIVRGESGLCHSLFVNLMRNAAEASKGNGAIDVTFKLESNHAVVTVRNDGAVPVAIRERFFEKYVTAGKPEGTGLGTYSAKLVTEAQNGKIDMTTDDVKGTAITVRLPVY